jgi:zinc transport system substrate-binding protein
MRNFLIFLFSLVLLPLQGVSQGLKVLVSIPPQKEWVESVGGDKVRVEVLIPQGMDPHTYEITPRKLQEVKGAEVYFYLGSGLEFEVLWLNRIKKINPQLEMVNCSQEIELLRGDPHVWLSLRNAEKSLLVIKETLKRHLPSFSEKIEDNYRIYLQKLKDLDRSITEWTKPYRGRAFMCYHPSLGYFSRDYGLKQIAVEEGHKEPSPKALLKKTEEAKKEKIKVIFLSPFENRKKAERIAKEIKAEIRIIDPLSEAYLLNMENIAKEVIRALQ